MIRIDYSIDLTSKKIQDYSIFPFGNNRAIITIATNSMQAQNSEELSYRTYIVNSKQCQIVSGVRVLDVWKNIDVEGLKRSEDNSYKVLYSILQSQSKDMQCSLLAEYEMNLIHEQLCQVSYLSKELIAGLSTSKDSIDLINLKPQTTNWLKSANQEQTQTIEKKQCVRDTIFNIYQSECSNSQINTFLILPNQDLLLHLGEQQHPKTNTCLLKLDIQTKAINWKHFSKRFEKLMSISIPFGHNSFVNGSYNLEDNVSSLNLYDFRVKGPVVRILHSSSDSILRLSVNRTLDPKFEILSKSSSPFTLMSLLSSGGGARSIPYAIDIRFPQKLSTIEMASPGYLSHVRGLHNFKSKVFAIQRQFKGYKALKCKLVVYQLET